MKLDNIAGKRNIFEYVIDKLERFKREEKTFRSLFAFMFSEADNVLAETTDGYRIKRVTYGECRQAILDAAPTFLSALSFVPKGELVGLYMNNSVAWIQTFWSLLRLGYRPLLMNTRLSDDTLEGILHAYGVKAVITDGKAFSATTLFAADLLQRGEGEAEECFAEEVLFMSSGTTENVKLCAYTAENFFYQICDSGYIVTHCREIVAHCEGQLKLLALLPFYHVFGFIAVYLWFGFFSRTFVFLKDLHPQTLLSTVRKHKVTHIFAVPLVWNTIHAEALRKIRARGESTFKRFEKALRFANKTGGFGTGFAKRAFKEIRQNIFGDSVRFMISGGSPIAANTLAFFNGIGYHLTNGYGMTEIGITSVELSADKKLLASTTVGAPFPHTEYKIENGELLVRGKAMASRILQGGKESITDTEAWFHTNDLAREENGRYYLLGRKDDLIVCRNGENLNPNLVESSLRVQECDSLCLFADASNRPVLLISVVNCFSPEKLRRISQVVTQALREEKLDGEIEQVVLTTDALMESSDFKISRKKVAKRYAEKRFRLVSPETLTEQSADLLSQLEEEVRACFAEALGKAPEEIDIDANFFLVLGGSSLDYFTLADIIRAKYRIEISTADGRSLASVKEVCEYLTTH